MKISFTSASWEDDNLLPSCFAPTEDNNDNNFVGAIAFVPGFLATNQQLVTRMLRPSTAPAVTATNQQPVMQKRAKHWPI